MEEIMLLLMLPVLPVLLPGTTIRSSDVHIYGLGAMFTFMASGQYLYQLQAFMCFFYVKPTKDVENVDDKTKEIKNPN